MAGALWGERWYKTVEMRTGGRILVDQLRIHGVETVFCVPGESYLAALDAFYDAPEIRLVVCRHEGGAAYMAEAHGKLHGRPGVCFVTRGPGATNASVGVHTAFQDSTPMVLLVGQVERDDFERGAFQEIDLHRLYGQMAKWVAQVEDARRIPEFIARAFATAVAGRPGPVVLGLPEDMLRDEVSAQDAGPCAPAQAHPGGAAMARLRQMLGEARQPVLLLGGTPWSSEASQAITAFAEANRLTVAVAFRRQDHFDNLHPCYAGHLGLGLDPKLRARLAQADLVLAVGARLDAVTTAGYSLLDVPRPRQKLVHVHPGSEELGRVYQPKLAINADPTEFALAARRLEPADSSAWAALTEAAHRDYLAYSTPVRDSGALQLAAIIAELCATLPADTIVASGAGNFSAWVHRFWRFRGYGTQLAPTSGSMGYGVPAGIAAALARPGRTVLSFSGDGCFLMNGQELATAMQYGAKPIFLVINNGMFGTNRMYQERNYPTRVIGTTLTNPDFAALARAYGLHGETVERTEDFAPAFQRARNCGRAALLELRLDAEAIAPGTKLSQITEAALAAQASAPRPARDPG